MNFWAYDNLVVLFSVLDDITIFSKGKVLLSYRMKLLFFDNMLGKRNKLYSWSSCYRPQRSCGQGNVFTGVCLSTGGEGVCLSACWDAIPPRPSRHPPGTRQTPPGPGRPPPRTRQTPPGPGRHPPGTRHPPGPGRPPPRKQTPAYGLRAAGTHPTGMHSCLVLVFTVPVQHQKYLSCLSLLPFTTILKSFWESCQKLKFTNLFC